MNEPATPEKESAMSVRRRVLLGFGLALLCCCVFLGCGPSGPRVVQVTGKVTRNGKAVPKATVNFVPDKGRPSFGVTDDEGNYTLHYDDKRDGAITGPHKVFIQF